MLSANQKSHLALAIHNYRLAANRVVDVARVRAMAGLETGSYAGQAELERIARKREAEIFDYVEQLCERAVVAFAAAAEQAGRNLINADQAIGVHVRNTLRQYEQLGTVSAGFIAEPVLKAVEDDAGEQAAEAVARNRAADGYETASSGDVHTRVTLRPTGTEPLYF